jgi:hypothetical protein
MGDKLTDMYDEWKKTVTDPTEYQAFQGGASAAAASMRHRAMAEVQKAKLPDAQLNALLTAIGTLPDIG